MPTTPDFGRVSSDFVTGNPISDVNTRLLISRKKNYNSGWKFNRIISRICPSFLFQIIWVLEFLFMSLKSPENSKCFEKNMFIYVRPCQLRKGWLCIHSTSLLNFKFSLYFITSTWEKNPYSICNSDILVSVAYREKRKSKSKDWLARNRKNVFHYSQTCIKRSPLGPRKGGLLRQVPS